MNHDYTHCSDYDDTCPNECFRAQLAKDLKPGMIVSFASLKDTDECMRGKCCNTCERKKDIERWDYSGKGCKHTKLEGFACLAFAFEGDIVLMVGVDPEKGMCECYMPKTGGNNGNKLLRRKE